MRPNGPSGANALRGAKKRVLEIVRITPDFAIGPQITPGDIDTLRDQGYAAIINARPDDEIGTYMLADEAEPLATAAGLAYRHLPTEGYEIFETEIIDPFEAALAELPRPIFSHCKTGTRAAMLWALVAARHREVEDVIGLLRAAGQELDFLEQELRESKEEAERTPLRLKQDALMNLGTSHILGSPDRDMSED